MHPPTPVTPPLDDSDVDADERAGCGVDSTVPSVAEAEDSVGANLCGDTSAADDVGNVGGAVPNDGCNAQVVQPVDVVGAAVVSSIGVEDLLADDTSDVPNKDEQQTGNIDGCAVPECSAVMSTPTEQPVEELSTQGGKSTQGISKDI